MGLQGDSRETYCSSHSIGDPGNPPMVFVATCNNRCHRKRRDRVPGREATVYDGLAPEKCVGKWTLRRNVRGPKPSCHCVYDAIEDHTVSDRFSSKEGCLLGVGVAACPTYDVERGWYKTDPERSGCSTHCTIEAMKGGCGPEIGSVMRICGQQPCRNPDDRNCGQPMPPLSELFRKKPQIFLIVEKVCG